MRNGVWLIGIVFAGSLAYVVGNRLSSEAMAVAVGALCGISASIPVSIALYIAASRNWGRDATAPADEMREYTPRGYTAPQPPFVVVSPPQFSSLQFQQQLEPLLPAPISNNTMESRNFKIVGED